MATAKDMAAACEVQMCNEAVSGVNTVRQALDRLIVTLVDVGESVATNGTRVDEVEGRGCLAWRHCN